MENNTSDLSNNGQGDSNAGQKISGLENNSLNDVQRMSNIEDRISNVEQKLSKANLKVSIPSLLQNANNEASAILNNAADDKQNGGLQALIEMFGSCIQVDVIKAAMKECGDNVSDAIERILLVDREDPQLQAAAQISKESKCEKQMALIVDYNHTGYKLLIIMRGVPGSGKTTLAREIVNNLVGKGQVHYENHIYSTDDYFSRDDGTYRYDVNLLHKAHCWNKKRATKAIDRGWSPVIIDNTNVKLREMSPYLEAGIKKNYHIEIVEPETPWAKRAGELYLKNTHSVPYHKIITMLESYENHVSTEFLLGKLHLSPNFGRPGVRNYPPHRNNYRNWSDRVNLGAAGQQNDRQSSQSIEQIEDPYDQTPNYTIAQKGTLQWLDNRYLANGYRPAGPSNQFQGGNQMQPYPYVQTSKPSQVPYSRIDQPSTSQYAPSKPIAGPSLFNTNEPHSSQYQFSPVIPLQYYNQAVVKLKPPPGVSFQPDKASVSSYRQPQCPSTSSQKLHVQLESPIIQSGVTYRPSENNLIHFRQFNEQLPASSTQQYSGSSFQNSPPPQSEASKQLPGTSFQQSSTISFDNPCKIPEKSTKDDEEKLLIEWENGEQWSETEIEDAKQKIEKEPKAQKPRNRAKNTVVAESFMPKLNLPLEWQNMSDLVPRWDHDVVENPSECIPMVKTNKEPSKLKIDPKESNYDVASNAVKKSDSKYVEEFNSDIQLNRCKNSDKHFIEFRRMFKNIPEDVLREIFDKCCGDVNWASEVVLDGIPVSSLNDAANEVHDIEDEHPCDEMCECTTKYLAPEKIEAEQTKSAEEAVKTALGTEINESQPTVTEIPVVKKKKAKVVSDKSAEIIRQIQESIDIPDYYYSNHCLKIKKLKHGIVDRDEPSTSASVFTESTPLDIASGSDASPPVEGAISEPPKFITKDEETLDVPLGSELIKMMVKMFENRTEDVIYPGYVVPMVNMPKSFLKSLYAMWLESLAHQIETQIVYTEALMKEDEDFARKLSDKEVELNEEIENAERSEIEEPDLRQIIDQELALSIAAKNAKDWKATEPDTFAARLSREKLFKLFPTIESEILAELLYAHNNNFNNTVEALLISTGQAEILKQENGVAKYVSERENQILEIERGNGKRLSDINWPVLGDNDKVGGTTKLEPPETYRSIADDNFTKKNLNQQKAQYYIQKGMGEVALYYTSLANSHARLSEYNNTLAATSIIQAQADKRSACTLDLHYLHVLEALELLDLFLDHHIQLLRTTAGRRAVELFLVTGRGLHSPRGPRIKPAVARRLRARGFNPTEFNPGLLTITLTSAHKLTHQLI